MIVDAVLSGGIRAGTRLGEQALATLFGVSRTSVREALIRLETRGILQVSPRRGWFVIEPSLEEIRLSRRDAGEMGILHTTASSSPEVSEKLRDHIRQERDAIRSGDIGARSYLLGDFHVCMAEACGHRILADILRDLTARTVLISALYQSSHDAEASCNEHAAITDAITAEDPRHLHRADDRACVAIIVHEPAAGIFADREPGTVWPAAFWVQQEAKQPFAAQFCIPRARASHCP